MSVREILVTADPVADGPAPARLSRRVLAGIAVAVFALYSTYAWLRHARYDTTGFDLGIFDQAVRAYSRFEAPIVPLKGQGYNLLGDHFHPVLALLAPLYWIWADPRMLLMAQAALLAVSIVPVARFTERRWGAGPAAAVAIGYGLSWPLQRAVQFDMHEIAFAVPLIALAIDALDRRDHRLTALACLGLLTVREDMGCFVAVVGVLVALRRGEGRRPLAIGAALIALGGVGYLFATRVVIPHFAPPGTGFVYWTFPALGPDLPSAVRFSLTHPLRVLELMVTPQIKTNTLVTLGLPTMFLCLGSRYVLLGLPFIAERMLNERPQLWQTNFHYSSVLAPILALAAVDLVTRVSARVPWRLSLPLPRVGRFAARRLRAGLVELWLVWFCGALVVGTVFQLKEYPVGQVFTSPGLWMSDSRTEAIDHTLPLIPPDVCVEAANQLVPQLTRTNYVTQVTESGGLASYVVIDMSQVDTGWLTPAPAQALELSVAAGFQPISRIGPIILLQRDVPVDPICRRH